MKRMGGHLAGQIKHLSGRLLNHMLIENGLIEFNGEQGKILFYLWQREGLTVSDIANETHLAVTTVSTMLDRMAESGLIVRQTSAADKRRKQIFLSVKGKKLKEKAENISARMNQIFYRDFSEEEITCVEGMMKRIVDNLKEELNNG